MKYLVVVEPTDTGFSAYSPTYPVASPRVLRAKTSSAR